MARRKRLRLAAVTSVGLGIGGWAVVSALAQPANPATGASAAPALEPGPGGGSRGPGPERGPWGRRGGPPSWPEPGTATQPADVEFTPEEQARFEAFMSARSPRKWQTFQKIQAASSRRAPMLRGGLAARYRLLQQLSAVDPVRYESELEVIRIEDEVYGLLQESRANPGVEPNDAELRKRAAELLDVRHKWRQERLRRAQAELADLKVNDAAAIVGRELAREEAGGTAPGAGRKGREEQIDQLVAKFKQRPSNPRMDRPLPGFARPPGPENGTPPEPPPGRPGGDGRP